MERSTNFTTDDVDLFTSPSRIIIAGYSNSGKSELCKKIITKYEGKFDLIIYCGTDRHDLEESGISDKFKVYKDLINPFDHTDFIDKGVLIIIDDLFTEAINNKNITEAFTKGRHKKISLIFITQNIFASGKYARNIALNSSHFILMRNRDMSQIENLGRQIFGREKGKNLVEVYQKSLSYNKYGYLLIDLSPETSEELQLRTNIVDETPYEVVFQEM